MNRLYSIQCRTHLHVGSGDSNYGVIDKMIQRDPTDNLPCIYSSSLKGAFRKYFEDVIEKGIEQNEKKITNRLFGVADKGKVVFHQAHLLSIPVRSNKFPYFNAISSYSIDLLINYIELLQLNHDTSFAELISELSVLKKMVQNRKAVVFDIRKKDLKIEELADSEIDSIEDFRPSAKLSGILGDRLLLLDDDSFKIMCSDYYLPVIARNHLENGQSRNLWYEQIIPRDSRFFFAVSSIEESDFDSYFINPLIVQIGANATIGYGIVKIERLA